MFPAHGPVPQREVAAVVEAAADGTLNVFPDRALPSSTTVACSKSGRATVQVALRPARTELALLRFGGELPQHSMLLCVARRAAVADYFALVVHCDR